MFLLTVLGYYLSIIWFKKVVAFVCFREEVLLRQRCETLCKEILETSSTDLVRRGQLEREEISLQKKCTAAQNRRRRYTFSITSLPLLFYGQPSKIAVKLCCGEGSSPHRTPCGRQAERLMKNVRLANVVDHVSLLGMYSVPPLLGYVIQFFPTALFLHTRGVWSTTVVMLPSGYFTCWLFPGRYIQGGMLCCPGWVWWALCILALKFVVRVFFS